MRYIHANMCSRPIDWSIQSHVYIDSECVDMNIMNVQFTMLAKMKKGSKEVVMCKIPFPAISFNIKTKEVERDEEGWVMNAIKDSEFHEFFTDFLEEETDIVFVPFGSIVFFHDDDIGMSFLEFSTDTDYNASIVSRCPCTREDLERMYRKGLEEIRDTRNLRIE